ncbi:ArgE/DapE family deacylase [Apibacter muscae]|uniref:Probable succinyl-diaminopimelate desuccinylase n=2 Tax=Apibacter muscae TaxID=2509004 RepID=A0A563DK64_9FLAO|nr:ArgE/DapE family deacylase [Apibacter muscae]
MMEKEKIDWLKDILKIDSTLDNEKEVADYIEKLFKEEGIETEQIEYSEGRNQLIATLKGKKSDKILGFTGHMDVVPVGEQEWEHKPFDADEKDGKIYARGASDMKGGLMAAVAAMIELKRNNVELNGDIQLLATVGEETSAIGAGQLVEKGYAKDLDALIIGEPTRNYVVIAHKGAIWLRLKTKGKTAHGSAPSEGINAVEHMLNFIEAFNKKFNFSQYKDDMVGPSTSTINVFKGGNATNVIPDQCIVEIDIRTIESQDHQEFLNELEQLNKEMSEKIKDFSLEIEVINDLDPVKTDENTEIVKLITSIVSKKKGEEVKPLGVSGYTDGSQFVKAQKNLPIIVLGPGEPIMAHQPDEYIEIENYLEGIEIYKEIAKEFLK